ncbi:porin [Ralstonia mannitolilytica]|uniref:Outer membrane porin protein 32 n=1 Tax=Ralstonia mannitolilytica TaxID=105219 RepID=A0AAJ4ZNL2_9RALS|nr:MULTISPECIES: porin [Ralstonia]MBU9580670.1 porin [Ralstonia mannitolilytica]PLT20388.1 porin [Ralstonia mannitolilytica]CAG2149876.1 Outer membrane porin protein 32 [Ralstonia mannitolilytica]CAJ0731702.1 Outer membrane porin protein 32 [Ralstonia mannitolilytica]SUD89141.1 Outer membrane porin protein 32 precursor [Ralstonia mannitolilytica]
MKKSAILVAVGALFAGSAYAQSSVTLYGIVDATIHYTTNANANGNSLVRLDNGAVSNSRWGLKGNEDLGGGNKALFVLESGFDPDTGRANGGGLFNRQAFVGLSNKDLGTITLGRQYNFGFTMGGNFDPLGVGNYDENSWIYYGVTGLRVSNMLKYEGKWSGLYVGLGYGFGEQAGSAADNRYMGGAVSYEFGPAMVGAFYQQQQDAPNALTGNQGGHKQKVWGIGGNYAVGPAKLYAGYIDSSDNTACVNSTTTCAGDRSTFGLNLYGNAAGAGLTPGATKRRDRIGLVGVTYQATPALALTGAFYYDSIKDAALAAGTDGKRYTGVLLAEYSLSKRTQLYGTVAYDKVKDAAAPELPGGTANGQNGKTNQVGVGLGIRHIF